MLLQEPNDLLKFLFTTILNVHFLISSCCLECPPPLIHHTSGKSLSPSGHPPPEPLTTGDESDSKQKPPPLSHKPLLPEWSSLMSLAFPTVNYNAVYSYIDVPWQTGPFTHTHLLQKMHSGGIQFSRVVDPVGSKCFCRICIPTIVPDKFKL